MEWKNCLPQMILDFISDSNTKEINIGCSDSHVIKIEKENKNYYLKIMKENFLLSEYRRLNWLAEKLSVPKVTMFVQENHYDYLITEEMPGQMLCEDYYLHHPKVALDVLKEAFQKLISVDISDCPFDVSNSYKLELVKKNIEKGLVKDDTLKEETREKFGTARQVLKYLEDNRFEEELVFSHGDTSLPNIFAKQDQFMGFIDVGECGIADKWFDLAICEKSILRNYGKEYVDKFYQILNIKRDSHKINYYLLMMELYL